MHCMIPLSPLLVFRVQTASVAFTNKRYSGCAVELYCDEIVVGAVNTQGFKNTNKGIRWSRIIKF